LTGIAGTGVHVAERGRRVSPNGQQRNLRLKPPSNFLEALEVGGIARVVNRIAAGCDYVAAISAVNIVEHPRSPVLRRGMGDGKIRMLPALPPVKFTNLPVTQIIDHIANVVGNNHHGGGPVSAAAQAGDGPQRGPVKVVKMRVSDQHHVDRGQIFDPNAGMAQAFQYKQPAGKVGVNQDVFSAELDQKTRVPDKGNTQVASGNRNRLVAFADARCQSGVPYNASKLTGFSSQSNVEHELFKLDAQK